MRAVVGIGSGFNATTLAEGIETEEQLQKLRAEGFSEVQGYLLGLADAAARGRGADPRPRSEGGFVTQIESFKRQLGVGSE